MSVTANSYQLIFIFKVCHSTFIFLFVYWKQVCQYLKSFQANSMRDLKKSYTEGGKKDVCYQFDFDYKTVSLSQNLGKKEE